MRYIGIDPSTKTGFVALSQDGQVLKAKELTGIGSKDPKRMVTLVHEVVSHLYEGDVVCIEGFPFATQRAMFAGGLHHAIRNELYKRGVTYFEAAPNAVKKWVGVSGWEGEKGSKQRLTSSQKKRAVMDAAFDMYGIRITDDNINDAFILAHIARSIELFKHSSTNLSSSHREIIETILEPVPVKKTGKKARA